MNLTKKAKIALGAVGAGVVVLGAGLGIWQPWNQSIEDKNDPVQPPDQYVAEVVRPGETTQEEENPTLTVAGAEIECTVYEGEGWTMYLPVDWVADENGVVFRPAADGEISLRVEWGDNGGNYAGNFSSVYAAETDGVQMMTRLFHSADTTCTWQVYCAAPERAWDEYQKLMTAMARTFTAGGEMLFSGFSPVASEPEWQISDGVTVMWMDKDGYVVDDVAEEHVVTDMLSWSNETKKSFTGQYRLEPFHWAGSYTCVRGKEYVDVFRSSVSYEVAPGREADVVLGDGAVIADGWLTRRSCLDVVIFHDGSAVEDVKVVSVRDVYPGESLYLADRVAADGEVARPLTAEELGQIHAWLMKTENNGLLRAPYDDELGFAAALPVILYDLGQCVDDVMTDGEKEALVAAGGTLELDTFKLERAYVEKYLEEKLGVFDGKGWLSANGENMPGIYLEKYDAWYLCRSDTMMGPYTLTSARLHPAYGGYLELYYTGDLYLADGTMEHGAAMVATLWPGRGGWYVSRNVKAG